MSRHRSFVVAASLLAATVAFTAQSAEPLTTVAAEKEEVVQVRTTHPPSPTTTWLDPTPPTTTTTTEPPRPVVAQSSGPVTPSRPAPVVRQANPTGDCYGHQEAVQARWPQDQWRTACRILGCESGGNPTAANRSSSASGVWQFLNSTWAGYGGYERAMYAPVDVQHDAAFGLWSRSGWSPWSCS